MSTPTDVEDVVAAFSQSVGVEKAREMVAEAAAAVGVDGPTYTDQEVVDICEVITEEYGGYVSIIARDILVEKQAEKRFYTLLESIPDPAVVVTYDETTPVVRNVNSAFESVFGYDRDRVLETSLNDFIVPDDDRERATEMDERLDAGREVEREVQRVTADGERRDFLLRGVTLTTDRGTVECYAIYTDITDRKERERELEARNERLDQFASVVSHDLRNPLNVAAGHLELARETDEDAHFEAVAEAHEQMEALIDRLLELARKGRTVGEYERCDLEPIVDRAWWAVETDAATLSGASELGVVEGDPDRLGDLFENLFRNAVDHGGDEVTVSVGMLDDGFYVADDGPGIPPEDRDAVREYGHTTAAGGTGLGLAIVDSIVGAHGWSLDIDASEADGARIEVRDVDRVA
jgi:PAS domain S-box-containing protein